MANEQTTALVLRDGAGDYFLLSQEVLERGRIPEERRAEVERLIAAGGPNGDDVQGYFLAGCGSLKPPTEADLGYPWYVTLILKHQESLGLR